MMTFRVTSDTQFNQYYVQHDDKHYHAIGTKNVLLYMRSIIGDGVQAKYIYKNNDTKIIEFIDNKSMKIIVDNNVHICTIED